MIPSQVIKSIGQHRKLSSMVKKIPVTAPFLIYNKFATDFKDEIIKPGVVLVTLLLTLNIFHTLF